MKIIKHLSNGYIFEDDHKGFKRLNIAAHGPMSSSDKRVIHIDNREYSAFDTYILLKNIIRLGTYPYIRLISCRSAEGGTESFAAQLSRFYERKLVKGYIGIVYTAPAFYPQFVMETVKKLDVYGDLAIGKNRHNFHSVTFKNGIEIKETPYSPHDFDYSCLDCFPELKR